MKLIVDISPEDYEYLKSYREFYDTSEGRILKAVCNGKDAMAVIAEVTATVLTEIQLEIEKLYPEHQCTGELTGFADAIETITPIIQQKINALKEGEAEDGKTNH